MNVWMLAVPVVQFVDSCTVWLWGDTLGAGAHVDKVSSQKPPQWYQAF